MKCVIAGPKVKIFGKAVHTLAKIGDELYLEPLESGLAVRTVNSSRSAFAGFTFSPSFFLEYEDRLAEDDVAPSATYDSDDVPDSRPSHFKGKIAVRSVLFVFKRLADMDKSVERCIVTVDVPASRVTFTLHCKHGIVKTHKLAFIDSETLIVNHVKSRMPNRIKSQPSVFIDAAACFHGAVEEIILEPLFDQLVIRNSDEKMSSASSDSSSSKTTSSTLSVKFSVSPDEFEVYVVQKSADENAGGGDEESGDGQNRHRLIEFNLKELRALLSFAETYSTFVDVYFGNAGDPIVFSLDSDPGFEADFVIATVSAEAAGNYTTNEDAASTSKTARPPPIRNGAQQTSTVKRAVLTLPSQHRRENMTPCARLNESSRLDVSGESSAPRTHVSTSSGEEGQKEASSSRSAVAATLSSTTLHPTTNLLNSAESEAKRKAMMRKLLGGDEDDSDEDVSSNQRVRDVDISRNVDWNKVVGGGGGGGIAGDAKAAIRRTKPPLLPVPESDDEEEDEDDVPTTPPSKKAKRSIFGFDSQNSIATLTCHSHPKTTSSQKQQILAEDSEED